MILLFQDAARVLQVGWQRAAGIFLTGWAVLHTQVGTRLRANTSTKGQPKPQRGSPGELWCVELPLSPGRANPEPAGLRGAPNPSWPWQGWDWQSHVDGCQLQEVPEGSPSASPHHPWAAARPRPGLSQQQK